MKSVLYTELGFAIREFTRKWARDLTMIAIAFSVAAGIIKLSASVVAARFDINQLRMCYSVRGPIPPPKDIVLVSIDDESVQALHVESTRLWPRIHSAKALEQIVRAHPKVVILDLKAPKESLDPVADEILEKALLAGPTSIWSGEIAKSDASTLGTKKFSSLTFPSDERFRKAAKMELPMWTTTTLGMKLLISSSTLTNAELYDRVPLARPLAVLGRFDIEAPRPHELIHYYGHPGTIPSVSLHTILGADPKMLEAAFKDKVVLMGFRSEVLNRGAFGDKDAFAVPVSDQAMYGVEIHATIAGNLIEGSWLKRMSPVNEFCFIFLSVFLITWLAMKLTPEIGIPLVFIALAGLSTATYYAFAERLYFIPGLGSIAIGAFIALLLSCAFNYKVIKRRIASINRAFGLKDDGF